MIPRRCPYCGATLDPSERCDCLDTAVADDAAEDEEMAMPTMFDLMEDAANG